VSNFITTAFIDEFRAGIDMLAQQEMSRLRSGVRVETVRGEREAFDQLGLTAMSKRTGRHVDTAYSDTPHERRWVIPDPYDVADLVDVPDRLKVLNDPTNEYSRSFAMAAGRQIDDVIVAAFTAAATTGGDGTPGATAFPAANTIAHGSAGLTIDKILNAKEILDENEEMDGDRFAVISARQFRDLLSLVEVTSADFNTVRALTSGRVDGFLGFNFIRSERLPAVTTTRSTFFWQKTAMLLGEAQSGTATIDRLPQKRNSMQVLYQMQIGATRMRETGVVEVLCSE
tara:strand:- start:17763 stop:18620 length:858 start_codon:yes stop_codon:yes gene_type:complete